MPKPKPRKPSEFFKEQLKIARKRRNLEQKDLSDKLKALGVNMDRATIAKLETGKRKISLDETLAIAAAMGISPIHLFLPIYAENYGPIEIAPKLIVEDPREARQWVRGQLALRDVDERFYREFISDDEWHDFQDHVFHYIWDSLRTSALEDNKGNIQAGHDAFIRAVKALDDLMKEHRKRYAKPKKKGKK